MSIVATSY